jgi:hypothetical protein
LGATAAVVVASMALGGPWGAWIDTLVRNGTAPPPTWVVPIPLALRVLAAAALVVWGARTDRRWTVVVGGMLALPSLGFASLSFLVGLGLFHASLWRPLGGLWRGGPTTHPDAPGSSV